MMGNHWVIMCRSSAGSLDVCSAWQEPIVVCAMMARERRKNDGRKYPKQSMVPSGAMGVLGSLVLADSVCAQNVVSFLARRDFPVSDRPVAVTGGDFNGDGILDLATANSGADSVSILLGQGDGTFGGPQDFGTGGFPVSITPGDFNGDGRLDLATANSGGNSVSILLGQGDGTFDAAQDFGTGAVPVSITAGDFNGDGRPISLRSAPVLTA